MSISMSVSSNPDTNDDRKRLKFGIFSKTARLALALILSATTLTSYTAEPAHATMASSASFKTFLTGLFLTGWFAKEQIAELINKTGDAVWPVNKQGKTSFEIFANIERPVVIKTINAAFQVAFKQMVRDGFRNMGLSNDIANILATAFDAGIKASSVLKLVNTGILPTLDEFKDLLSEAFSISASLTPSEYRYVLNHPLDVTQGTAKRCGAHDPYCLHGTRQDQPVPEKIAKGDLQDQALKFGGSLLLTAAGWKLADVAYEIGQVLSPVLPRLLFPTAFGGDVAPGELEKYLQKVVQRFAEIQFGDVFVRMLASVLREGHTDLEKAYDALPEDKKNDPEARAKVAKDVEKTVVGNIVRGIQGVIGYKVSWPAERAFLDALTA